MNHYLIANYHTHTTRCKHAKGDERQYIEAAIAAGLSVLGFADHAPCPFPNGFVSRIRMDMKDAKDYVLSIRALQEEYANQIQLLVGFEAEYMPQFFDEQMALFDKLCIDYLIMGQHFLESEELGPYTGSPTHSAKMLSSYVDRVIEGMKTGRFSYLAHPDLIHYIDADDFYKSEITRLCTTLKELNIPLELNLLGLLENKHYPRDDFWSIAGTIGNDVILGIDAHWPEQIGDIATYNRAMSYVKEHNLHLIDKLSIA